MAVYDPLREAIAEYLGAARGVHCDAQQILITSGAQQALDLMARILLDPGDRVWFEDPGYPGTRSVSRAAGAHIIPVPVDRDGLDVAAARTLVPSARMVYTTPANHFPPGVTMSLDRRLALLKWAVNAGAWIIEDEYDAEYRYFGRPVAALQSLDRSGSVIYIGTFAKMLFNALRLGFLVLPGRLVSAFEAVRSFVDRHPPTLDQAVLAEFILEGHFGHHVRRMRRPTPSAWRFSRKPRRSISADCSMSKTPRRQRSFGGAPRNRRAGRGPNVVRTPSRPRAARGRRECPLVNDHIST